MREEGLSAEAWLSQREGLSRVREEETALREQRRALREEREGLSRALTVLPLLAQYRKARGDRQAFGEQPPLPPDAMERRVAAERALSDGEHLQAQLEAQLEKLASRRAQLEIPETLAELDEEVIRGVSDALGKHRAAQDDLPRRRQQLRAIEGEVRALLRRLGRPAKLDALDELQVDRQAQGRVRALSSRGGALAADVEHAEQDRARVAAEHLRIRLQLDASAAPADHAPLEQALSSVRRLGDLGSRLTEAQTQVETLEQGVERKRAALGLFAGEVSALAVLPLPAAETIERFARELGELERRGGELRTRAGEVAVAAERVRRDHEGMTGAGSVPSEAQLEQARALRDKAFELVRRSWRDGEDVDKPSERLGKEAELGGDAEALFAALRERADSLSDRLRREATRVAELARIDAERASLERQAEQLDGQLAELDEERNTHEHAWAELFDAAGIAPRSPVEMRAWLGERERLLELFDRLEAARREAARLTQGLSDGGARLEAALAEAGESVSEGADLPALLSMTESAAERLAEQRAERSRAEQRLGQLAEDLAELDAELEAKRAALADHQGKWGEAVAVLGLREDATVSEALEVIDDLQNLMGRVDALENMRGRIVGIERIGHDFELAVRRLSDRHLYQLSDRTVEEEAEELVRRFHAARASLRERDQIDADVIEAEQAMARARAEAGRARAELVSLCRQAGVETPEALPAVEQRVREALRKDAELAELERQLLEHGGGADLDAIFALTEGVEDSAARGRVAEIDDELEASDDHMRELTADIARQEGGMRRLEERQGAAEAALEVAELAATIRADAERYARLRLAAVVLEREIARYRSEHQGPVLTRASELFVKLTSGGYRALEVAFDGEQPTLQCIASDGREVSVERLSDGTRDQLYLALRIASLMRFVEHAEPMPLILDDILIHFDDERATAALTVLAELARTTQVLFFTHHHHLLDLARQALPAEALVVHRLMDAREQAAVAPA